MLFFVALLAFIIIPIMGIGLIGSGDFTTVVLCLFAGLVAWGGIIRAIKKEKEQKRRRASYRQTYRRRTEDDFLNNYGYIDNSAFGSITSFTHHDYKH